MVIICCDIQAFIDQCHIDTDIFVQGDLPVEVGVTELIQYGSHTEIIHRGQLKIECRQCFRRTEVLVAGVTDRGPQF